MEQAYQMSVKIDSREELIAISGVELAGKPTLVSRRLIRRLTSLCPSLNEGSYSYADSELDFSDLTFDLTESNMVARLQVNSIRSEIECPAPQRGSQKFSPLTFVAQ